MKFALLLTLIYFPHSVLGGEPPLLKEITSEHNAKRKKHGLEDLTWDDGIAKRAQVWAEYLKKEHGCGQEHSINVENALQVYKDGGIQLANLKFGENLAGNTLSNYPQTFNAEVQKNFKCGKPDAFCTDEQVYNSNGKKSGKAAHPLERWYSEFQCYEYPEFVGSKGQCNADCLHTHKVNSYEDKCGHSTQVWGRE